ncbi:MAG: DeoR family transcriptional regulator [Lachnospiraceae bacterium]|nr:DeoR family transcriptional regulator [Lachnospiraceae bacterium]
MKNSKESVLRRQLDILNVIREQGEVTVEKLSDLFNISVITIRRDLEVLEQQNLITRVHGGAISMERGGTVYGDVIDCRQVVKKDKKGRETYNFYNVTVEFTNPDNQHRERHAVKMPSEFALGQQVEVLRDKSQGTYGILESETQFVINPWEMMVGGALLILLALFTNQGKEVPAMACLSLVLAGAGAALIWDYVSLKKKNLLPVEGEIIRLHTRQLSRNTKIIKGDKFTYYPVVKYTVDGRENIRRCSINSGNENSFRIGDPFTLYYDRTTRTAFERNARPAYLIAGLVILAVGLLAGVSILSVVL